jgi:Tol biopolymer transport system component
MGGLFLVFLIVGILTFRKSRKFKSSQNPLSGSLAMVALSGFSLSVLCVLIALFSNRFILLSGDLVRVNYETMESEVLTRIEADKQNHPAYSSPIDMKYFPDGSGLVMTRGTFRGSPGMKGSVWTLDLANKELERITHSNFNDGFGDFSESEQVMVFRSDRDGPHDIFVQENGQILNLTKNPDRDNFPAISADGKKIVFSSDINGLDVGEGIKTMDLYLTEKTTSGEWSKPKQLTQSKGQDAHAHFSPDGEWIIYATEEFGINDEQPIVQSFLFAPQMYGEIVALRLSDGKKVKLTHNKWEEGAPLWVPALLK